MTRIAHTFHLLLHACMIHWSIGTYVLAPLPLLLLQLLLPGDALEDNRMIRCCALQIVLYAAAAPSHATCLNGDAKSYCWTGRCKKWLWNVVQALKQQFATFAQTHFYAKYESRWRLRSACVEKYVCLQNKQASRRLVNYHKVQAWHCQ